MKKCATRFYLTGGTALSRGYYNHRYSDDLDFFVTNDAEYKTQVKIIIAELEKNGFIIDKEKDYVLAHNFSSFKVRRDNPEILLKIDLVNDLVVHFGDIVPTPVFFRTDNIRNMLSNKMGALFRYAAKDVADIRAIALNERFAWEQLLKESSQKDAGIQLDMLAEVLRGMPEKEFDKINWTIDPTWEKFQKDIQTIAEDMIFVRENTLERQ
ncbi:MAG: nucleotidyl transferase AbiEii/AbiGii toxin family protein [Endomicrobia bacterium]|nr:nucleotidyl transferase AbiEii/AbiGii toxin family protein [Endomicrobiia bacterium]